MPTATEISDMRLIIVMGSNPISVGQRGGGGGRRH